MASLRLQLLGGFSARLESGVPIAFPTRKTRALLSYLAVPLGKPHSRDKLATLLWEDSGAEQARANLRQTLTYLRKVLSHADGARVATDGDTVALDPQALGVDVADFERLAAESSPAALERAAELYQGDFLEGFDLAGEAFEDWQRLQRQRLRGLAVDVLNRHLADRAAVDGSDSAVQAATRLLAIDPLREDVHRALMRFWLSRGQRTLALKQYEECRAVLRRELDTGPDRETERLYREIRDGLPETSPSCVTPLTDIGTETLSAGDDGSAVATPAQPSRRPPRTWAAAVAGAAAVIAVVAIVLWSRPWAPLVEPASVDGMPFPLPDKPSIAVLPFDNLSGDPMQEYLSDGLSEDIINAISRLPDLFVIARNSSFTYKGKPVKVQQVAEELGVRYVLEGSVQRSDDRLRVSAQLVDALNGRHLWSQRYDRAIAELFAVKDEITLNIMTGLQIQLLDGQFAKLERRDTDNLEAWLLAKEGRGHAMRFTKEDNVIARELLEKAVRLDPEFVPALVGLGWRHLHDARNRWTESPERSFEKARHYARIAMDLRPSHSAPYSIEIGIRLFKHEHDAAIAAGKRGLALDPNSFDIAALLGLAYQKSLQVQKAIRMFKAAMRLSPYYPDWILENLGESYLLAEQYDEAVAAYQKVLERSAVGVTSAEAHLGLALCYDALGRLEEARAEIAKLREVAPRWSISFLRGWHWYKDDAYVERNFASLRRLGLPEE